MLEWDMSWAMKIPTDSTTKEACGTPMVFPATYLILQFLQKIMLTEGQILDSATRANFQTNAQCIATFYSNYTVYGTTKLNGEQTLGENIADIGIRARVIYKSVLIRFKAE